MSLLSLGRMATRTNLKAVNPGKHRDSRESNPRDAEIAIDDHELTSYLAALAPEPDQHNNGASKRFGDARVFQLRLDLAASEQLKDAAVARGMSPQAMAQEWILERLSWEAQAAPSYPQWPHGQQH